MGAAASIGATPEERAANNELLMKELAGEYEALRHSGKTDAEIAAQLEEAIKTKAPMLFSRTTDVVPSPLKSRMIVDYDVLTGHKVVTQLDEVVPLPSATTAQAATKPATTGSTPGTPVSGAAASAEVEKVVQGAAQTVAVLQQRTSHHFLVAIDGSDSSHQAYLTALRLRKGTDVLELFHFYDPQKVAELSPHLKPERIKERYEVELVSRLPKERYALAWLEKGDLTTRNLVVHYCNQQANIQDPSGPRASFLVLGYTGRRGPEEAPQLMGSVVDLTLRAAHLPTLIVKKALPEVDQPRVFVVAVDEAERCWNAYLTTLLLARPKDKVTVLHLYDDTGVELNAIAQMSSTADRSTLLGTRYERDMAERGLVGASFVSLPQPRGAALHTAILDYSLEHDADIVVLAPRPQEKLCSVAEHLVQKGKANVLVVKN